MRLNLAMAGNLIMAAATAGCVIWYFCKKQTDKSRLKGWVYLRYFTTLSNILSGLGALAAFAAEWSTGSLAAVPGWIWGLKYAGCAAVSVTMFTVLFHLGPIFGYRAMFYQDSLYMHLIGPVLALVTFCIVENARALSAWSLVLGVLPVLVYGLVYLNQTVRIGVEKGGWEDFYSFNRDGKWRVSFAAMILLAFVLSVLILVLHNAFVV